MLISCRLICLHNLYVRKSNYADVWSLTMADVWTWPLLSARFCLHSHAAYSHVL